MATNPERGTFTLGLDAGLFGRWARLIIGAIVPNRERRPSARRQTAVTIVLV